jgi:hypothetical protein
MTPQRTAQQRPAARRGWIAGIRGRIAAAAAALFIAAFSGIYLETAAGNNAATQTAAPAAASTSTSASSAGSSKSGATSSTASAPSITPVTTGQS